jgi:hypothetical protein
VLAFAAMWTTRVLPPGWKDTLVPSVEATKLVLVCTPDIERTMLALAGSRVAWAVVEIAFVEFRFATVKLAVAGSPGLIVTILLSGVRINGWEIDGVDGRETNAGSSITAMMMTTSVRKAHMGTGRLRKRGFFCSMGPGLGYVLMT